MVIPQPSQISGCGIFIIKYANPVWLDLADHIIRIVGSAEYGIQMVAIDASVCSFIFSNIFSFKSLRKQRTVCFAFHGFQITK